MVFFLIDEKTYVLFLSKLSENVAKSKKLDIHGHNDALKQVLENH